MRYTEEILCFCIHEYKYTYTPGSQNMPYIYVYETCADMRYTVEHGSLDGGGNIYAIATLLRRLTLERERERQEEREE